MERAVILRNVRKRYGENLVLNGVDLEIEKGCSVCIIGRNGSGKSTLLRIIAGLTDFEGTAELNVSEIGFVAQQPALYSRLTVRDNIELFSGLSKNADRRWINELVALLGLEEFMNVPVEKLSHGTVKKLDLVCALVGNPELVLLDEPLVSLDVESREAMLSVYDLFREKGKTVVSVTHFIELLKPKCDAVYLLEGGKLKRID
ncbi:ABC transporter ATP-binding protein [Thermococcus gammatolerans]|uniref:ABC transporter, ATP-binding protein n=1 Tax=Thermococcus gammatolerans (strain DSM 15229 / JCM 11827 / EJ3) TaxID=593117 RepID=C5A6K9_THEGJ|nr:ABC transporter ATP-binding protein [Thermococcus gammatolerans]ACS33871.1 ABC transporter, ATP-binding protein [Thermococcus gammatolerans EJ3]